METFTIAQTARHLGISDQGVRKMIGRQELFLLPGFEPARLDAEHVETARLLRREALLLELASKRRTPVTLAQDVRRSLFPPNDTLLPHRVAEHQRRRLSLLPTEARQLFGAAALSAALVQDKCRWCAAQDFARVLGGWAPTQFSPGFRALFDQDPCAQCAPGLYGAVLASLEARVHPGRHRPPDPVAEAIAAEIPAVPAPRPQRAQPVQDDDGGRALVAARLRTARARLKDAKRRNDQAYVLRLAQTVRSLEADAAAVDGRAAAPRGRKACGTPVGVRCECHTSDRRGQR